jgi:mono/diheme cytochrome c family protein
MQRIGFCGLVFFAASALTAWPQEQSAGTSQKKTVEKVSIQHTSAGSGEEMFISYCAACHGKGGRGDGPAASALKHPPPDLTLLAKNNQGKYPADRVSYVLRSGVDAPAHGSKDMPVWGPLFGALRGGRISGNEPEIQLRVTNLTKYIESLQSK